MQTSNRCLYIVVFIGLLLTIVGIAQAQEVPDKSTPIDTYPAARTDGALAYKLADPWRKTDLTFYFHNCPTNVTCAAGQNAVRQAFQRWAAVSALTFQEVTSASAADIEITWTINHSEFGYPGDVLAFAYFPRHGGDVFFDDAENWSVGGSSGNVSLYEVAVHEIGHALGLDHSSDSSAIMYAYAGYARDVAEDDIQAVQRLYGAPTVDNTVPVTPNPPAVDTPVEPIPQDIEIVEGVITNSQWLESWQLTVEAGDTVTITMMATSGDLDPYIGILDLDQYNVLVENGDYLDNGFTQITHTFTFSGVYEVVATRSAFDEGYTTGDYSLLVEFNPEEILPTPPATVNVQFVNYSGTTLCKMYFSPTASDDWGDDVLGFDVLENNYFITLEYKADYYDLVVYDCFSNWLEEYAIDVSWHTVLYIYADRIEAVPLQ